MYVMYTFLIIVTKMFGRQKYFVANFLVSLKKFLNLPKIAKLHVATLYVITT